MSSLTPDQVRALAALLGLAVADEDLGEITHRLNAFGEALAPLAALPLEGVEPRPVEPDSFP
jgi:hypothetical protein